MRRVTRRRTVAEPRTLTVLVPNPFIPQLAIRRGLLPVEGPRHHDHREV